MRQARVRMLYNGVEITEDISGDVRSFKYTASASDEADTVDVTLADPAKKWLLEWRPQPGDSITAAIELIDWERDGDTRTIQCGRYILDEPGYSAPPHTQTLSAISVPCNTSFVCAEKSRTWTDAAVSEIAAQIAAENAQELYWDSGYDPRITMEQTKTADLDFIAKLCKDYTLRLKAADGQIVIYDPLAREGQPPVMTIRESGDAIRYSLRHTYLDTAYTDAEITTVDADTGEYHMMEDTAKYQGLTEEEAKAKYGKTLTDEAAEITSDPELVRRKLQTERMKEYTASVVLPLTDKITEGCAVQLSGFGGWDANWIVDKLAISMPDNKMTLTLHKAVIE